MSSPSLTSTATLTSHTSSPDMLPSNVTTPRWTTRSIPELVEPWFPKHTPLSSSPMFPTPSPPSLSLPIAISSSPTTIETPPILSVNVPVHCHCFRSFPTPAKHATLVAANTDPHLAIPFNHYFDDGCPFKALHKAYLQVKRFGVIIHSLFTTQNAIAPIVKHIAHDVQTGL